MKVRFLRAARDEFRGAIRYYNSRRSGLCGEFREEVRAAVQRIEQYPHAWHPLGERFRRCLTRRFPYGVIYEIRDDEILIVAVAHLHREPDYWRKRPN